MFFEDSERYRKWSKSINDANHDAQRYRYLRDKADTTLLAILRVQTDPKKWDELIDKGRFKTSKKGT